MAALLLPLATIVELSMLYGSSIQASYVFLTSNQCHYLIKTQDFLHVKNLDSHLIKFRITSNSKTVDYILLDEIL